MVCILLAGCTGAGVVPGSTSNLVVAAPAVSDGDPAAGAAFTLSATVRNDGAGVSEVTTLRYYRSTDATITTSDLEVGSTVVASLAASGSRSEAVGVTAPETAGTYYYGACVDAVTDESDTNNNCSSSVRVTVEVPQPGAPDLVVAALSASDTGPTAGAAFTLSALVINVGNGTSAATTLRYYRSTDATITTLDTQVGTDEVAGLVASRSSSRSAVLTAPASAGTYYYGACVDAVNRESDLTNNCSPSVQVTVRELAPQVRGRPDLAVALLSVSDSSPVAGASFTLTATVGNLGGVTSPSTTLRYYRSTDPTITASDTALGTAAVGALPASGSSAESTSLTAPSRAGTYHYGACVDAVTAESDTTNNCSTSVQVTVRAAPAPAPAPAPVPAPQVRGQPDLVVPFIRVDSSYFGTNDEGEVATNEPLTVLAIVINTGNLKSAATTLRYFRSTDATITTSDLELGTDAIAELAGQPSSPLNGQSLDITAPATVGIYYYGACVDAVADESDTTSNCSTSVKITVREPKLPDLVVGPPSVTDSSPAAGAWFTLSAAVRNVGNGGFWWKTKLRYYRSTDATVTPADTQVGSRSVRMLLPSESSEHSHYVNAPQTPGTYYYGACVDAVADESDTTNNCSTSVEVTVPQPPDLVVATPTVSDSSPDAGATFTLSTKVHNNGDEPSAATTLRYYRSADSIISPVDTEVATDQVDALAASGTSDESVSLTAELSAGTYYYGACVDSVADESDTTNNCSSSVAVDVQP